MRRAIPKPCNGPKACRVFRIIMSRVPCKTSDLPASIGAPLDTPKKLPCFPLRCPQEGITKGLPLRALNREEHIGIAPDSDAQIALTAGPGCLPASRSEGRGSVY